MPSLTLTLAEDPCYRKPVRLHRRKRHHKEFSHERNHRRFG